MFKGRQASNAGFFNLGNHLVIFDTLMDPFSTRDLIIAAEQFTNMEPSFLINSHYHMDHLFGNNKFPINIPIISSSATLGEYQEFAQTRLKEFRDQGPDEIKRLQGLIPNEKDKDALQEMKNDIAAWKEIMDSSFILRPPDFIVEDSFIIQGTENKVHIEYIGNAHSKGDMVALFENEKICFMGDLLFQKMDPAWAEGFNGQPFAVDPVRLRDILINLSEKDIEIYIPGHGDICTSKELKENAQFVEKYCIK
jgi:glyoxylase-like metal-dependent hydrolase (beta-lactamase superfamily II)